LVLVLFPGPDLEYDRDHSLLLTSVNPLLGDFTRRGRTRNAVNACPRIFHLEIVAVIFVAGDISSKRAMLAPAKA
jgi:hypothetical protein